MEINHGVKAVGDVEIFEMCSNLFKVACVSVFFSISLLLNGYIETLEKRYIPCLDYIYLANK